MLARGSPHSLGLALSHLLNAREEKLLDAIPRPTTCVLALGVQVDGYVRFSSSHS